MPFWEAAHDLDINGGQFIDGQTVNIYQGSGLRTAAEIIQQHTAIDATHESANDMYTPRCTPGTRKEVIADIIKWAEEAETSSPIAWLSGPAGGGKTSVQRDVATHLQLDYCDSGRLAATYFFSSQLASQAEKSGATNGRIGLRLDTIQPFIATIAYQMSASISGLREYIEDAVARDPLVFEKGVAVQARKVLMDPLNAWRKNIQAQEILLQSMTEDTDVCSGIKDVVSSTRDTARMVCKNELRANISQAHSAPRTISIDGFDEIKSHQDRGQLLHTVRQLSLFEPFPLRFIISSRPEPDLTEIFALPMFSRIVTHIRLEIYKADHDVRLCLKEAFARIQATHPAKALLTNWPTEEDIETLVWKSSGQFIYPATVIRFVNNRQRNPVDLLWQVLHMEGRRNQPEPLASLYNLYSMILASTSSQDFGILRSILHTIPIIKYPSVRLSTPALLDDLLSYPTGTSSMALDPLASLVHIPAANCANGKNSSASDSYVRFFHKSFDDYLRNLVFAGPLFYSARSAHLDILQHLSYFSIWEKHDFPLSRSSLALDYITMYWDKHLNEVISASDSRLVEGSAQDMPEHVLLFDPGLAQLYRILNHIAWAPFASPDLVHQHFCVPRSSCIPLCFRICATHGNAHVYRTAASTAQQAGFKPASSDLRASTHFETTIQLCQTIYHESLSMRCYSRPGHDSCQGTHISQALA